MSNSQLDVVVVALLALHLGVLALALTWRPGRRAMLWLNGGDAAAALAWLAFHPRAFRPPVDWPVVAFAAFEIAVLTAVVMAMRGTRPAVAAAWAAFAVHLVASGLAAAFALTFRITRLF